MVRFSFRLFCGLGAIVIGVLSPAFSPLPFANVSSGQVLADAPDSAEKDAFEAAKELGTSDAWKAFLANYATGFHADLARAYLKKLGDAPATAATPPADDFPVAAGSWGGIVRDGPGQSYRKVDSLEEGQTVTLMGRTDVMENGFPWLKIAYGAEGAGTGFQWGGILCSVSGERPDIYKTCPPPPAPKARALPTASPTVKKACASGKIIVEGKCMSASAAVSFCGPGCRAEGGKCVPRSQPVQKKASASACPKGQVWNAQEGCHYDD